MKHWKWVVAGLLLSGPAALAEKGGKPPPGPEAELPDVDAIEKSAAEPAPPSSRRGVPPVGTQSKNLSAGTDQTLDEQGAQQIEGTTIGLLPPGGLYGVESSTMTPVGSGEEPQGQVPEYHVVKKGDTLWSMCQSYFRDPWRWPKLWAQNPLITNPHWIFPGDVVRLHAAGAPVAAPVAAVGGTGTPLVRSTRTGSLASNALVLRQVGFVEAKDLAVSAVISGSREEKILLSTDDQAYLKFPQERPLRAGERYTVFMADTDKPIRAPNGEVLGYLVRIYGDIVVNQIADGNTARGSLVDLMDPVERGALVSPLIRQFRRVEPKPSEVNLEARIVAAFSPTRMLSPETFVVLSRGKNDGIQIGNRTFVVRRGDGYRRIMEGWEKFDPNYPNEVVGELWVVDVRDNTSLAWIARSTKEIRVGETAEMRKGH